MKRFFWTISACLTLALTLIFNDTQADDRPLQATESMPKYQLSNIRKETDQFGQSVIAFDWKRTKNGTGYPEITGKTKNGSLTTFGTSLNGESGTARFQDSTFSLSSLDVEFWVITMGAGAKEYMLSNTVRLGNPGPVTTARPLTAQEKAAAEKAKLAATPPGEPPAGYEAVTAGTTLVPGMPVKAGWMGQWDDGEILSLYEDGRVSVLYPNQDDTTATRSREDWIAVQPSVLARAKSSPEEFKPSRHVLPNSRLVVPNDAVVIPGDVTLPEGTPVLVDYRYKWHDAYVVRDLGDQIEIRYKGYGSTWDKQYPRGGSLIRSKTLASLDNPDMVEKYAKNLNEDGSAVGSTTVADYPIRGRIPNDAQIVPDALDIPDDSKLGAWWGSSWYKMTLLRSNDDGTLHVRWDSFGDAWDCDMKREQLIIAKTEVRKLERLAKSQTKEAQHKERTWKDASGKFTIEATFVSKGDDVVVLKTAGGEDVEIPYNRLSKEDQKHLEEMDQEADNPFRKR